jgi:hypothetical protein
MRQKRSKKPFIRDGNPIPGTFYRARHLMPNAARVRTHSCRLQGLPLACEAGEGNKRMRFILGIIVGCALTVGVAYITDAASGSPADKPMVNWDVVAKHVDTVTTLAREGWKKIAG